MSQEYSRIFLDVLHVFSFRWGERRIWALLHFDGSRVFRPWRKGFFVWSQWCHVRHGRWFFESSFFIVFSHCPLSNPRFRLSFYITKLRSFQLSRFEQVAFLFFVEQENWLFFFPYANFFFAALIYLIIVAQNGFKPIFHFWFRIFWTAWNQGILCRWRFLINSIQIAVVVAMIAVD